MSIMPATFKVPFGEGQADRLAAENMTVTFSRARDNAKVSERSTSFHELYTRFAAEVYRFAYWLTGNVHDANDLTAETFARVWMATEEPRLESVKAYLFTIARNLYRKEWRRAKRQELLDETMPDPAATPDATAVSREECRHALEALQKLPELDRAVLLMRAEEDLSYEDIAAATGMSATAARVRVFRARQKLLQLVNPNLEEAL
jgi:RNA polymerase sigma-70 factor (ECF subfamily)